MRIHKIKKHSRLSVKQKLWKFFLSGSQDNLKLNINKFPPQLSTHPALTQSIPPNQEQGNEDKTVTDATFYFMSSTLNTVKKRLIVLPNFIKYINYLRQVILAKSRICIVSDYDVDGLGSTAMLVRFMRCYGCEVDIMTPDRLEDGYGINENIVARIEEDKNYQLVITVDNGTNAKCLENLTTKVMVIDHHVIIDPPANIMLINGHLQKKVSKDHIDLSHLCTGGLVYTILHLLIDRIRKSHPCRTKSIEELQKCEILSAMTTICDMVPLTAVNSAIIRHVLYKDEPEESEQAMLSGVQLLIEKSGFNKKHVSPADLGFMVGPLINAVSRITGKTNLVMNLLLSDERKLLLPVVNEMTQLNKERKAIENETTELITDYLNRIYPDRSEMPACLILRNEDWHLGVIGIVAGCVAREYNRPTLVLTKDGEYWRGSGRSIPGFNLVHCLHDTKKYCSSLRGGGHGMAIGCTVHDREIDDFERYFNEAVNRTYLYTDPVIYYHGKIAPNAVDLAFVKILSRMEPFGIGHERPLFLIQEVKTDKIFKIGAVTRFKFTTKEGRLFDAIIFNKRQAPVDNYLYMNSSQPCNLLVSINLNTFANAMEPQILIEDVMAI